jgi:outer membrane protein
MLVMLPVIGKAQEQPMPLSLQDAMDYAVKNNSTAKNARLDYLIQKAKNDEITGIALPQVSGKGEFDDYINPVKSFIPGEFFGGAPGSFTAVQFTPKYSNTASVSASQVLFDGSVLVALQARKAILDFFEKSTQMSEEEVRYNVQKSYYALVAAGRQFSILTNSIGYLRKITNDLDATYKQGLVEKIEVDRSRVTLNNLVTDSIKTVNTIMISEQMLKYKMGMSIDRPIVLIDSSVEEKIIEANQLLNTGIDYSNRTDYNLLESQLRLNQYDLKRHKLSGVPSLAAFGTAAYNYSTSNFKDLFNEQYIFYSLVGLQLKVPIFDGLQRHNRVKQAKLAIEQTTNNIENMKLNIDFQNSQSKTTLRNTLLALENQKTNFELASSVLELAVKKYNAGVGSNLEVSQAQSEMLKAQGSYLNSMLDVVNASSDLKKALGDFKN